MQWTETISGAQVSREWEATGVAKTPRAMSSPLAADRILAWFMRDTTWSRAGLRLAIALLLLAPIARRRLGRARFLVYLQLPVYMLHQYEEHAHGAFKREANRLLPSSVGRLTDRNIFWINILGVWGVDCAALALARCTGAAAGLVAPYLAVVNGLSHLGLAIRSRRSNPGLWTSVLLFLPVGGYSARAIGRETRAGWRSQAASAVAALVLHLVVVLTLALDNRRRQRVRGRRDHRRAGMTSRP